MWLHSLQDAHSQVTPLPAELPYLVMQWLHCASKACNAIQFLDSRCREQLLQGRHPQVLAGSAAGALYPGKLRPHNLRCALILQAPLQSGKHASRPAGLLRGPTSVANHAELM